jgi:hypothetical protein
MNPTSKLARRIASAAIAVFLLIAAGAPIAYARDDDDDRRGRHGRRDHDRHHRDHDKWDRRGKHGKKCWRPKRHWDYYCPRHCRRHHRHRY